MHQKRYLFCYYIQFHVPQRKALFDTKPVLGKTLSELLWAAVTDKILVIGDLGCSSGENTLIFVSEVIKAFSGRPVELQFVLNDLPHNDFNHIFRSLGQFKESITEQYEGGALPPFYLSGLPGSYYTRLFPCQSVHLFHSSYCLHWRSGVP